MEAKLETPKDMSAEEVGKPMSWDEAKEFDALSSKYFKPETNIKYILTFRGAKLVKRMKNKFVNGKPIEEKEEKVCLDLDIETRDGKPVVDQVWEIVQKSYRENFEPYCVQGTISKMVFEVQVREVNRKKILSVAAIKPK